MLWPVLGGDASSPRTSATDFLICALAIRSRRKPDRQRKGPPSESGFGRAEATTRLALRRGDKPWCVGTGGYVHTSPEQQASGLGITRSPARIGTVRQPTHGRQSAHQDHSDGKPAPKVRKSRSARRRTGPRSVEGTCVRFRDMAYRSQTTTPPHRDRILHPKTDTSSNKSTLTPPACDSNDTPTTDSSNNREYDIDMQNRPTHLQCHH